MSSFPTNIYFLGIGGIGMSALARYFLARGHRVYGFDRTQTDLCRTLEKEGANITYDESVLQEEWRGDCQGDALVVRTPAVRENNLIYKHFVDAGFPMKKRSEVLGRITSGMTCLAVAGTHGKTTTTAMLAHLFHAANRQVYAFLGGVAVNYKSNFLEGNEPIVVVEADEFDRSFLHLEPNWAVITNTDSDHLDIYQSKDKLEESFRLFADKAKANGALIVQSEVDIPAKFTYTSGDAIADFKAVDIRIDNGVYAFRLCTPEGDIDHVTLALPGKHNVENAVAASALALMNGLTLEQVRSGLNTFLGVNRRFVWHHRHADFAVIDDYAHHPSELRALINTVLELYPQKKIALVFQPHLYSRTRDFVDEFAAELDRVDAPALLPVYAARENPDEGMDSSEIIKRMKNVSAVEVDFPFIGEWLEKENPDVVVSAGAGDVDQCMSDLLSFIQKKSVR